MPPRSPFRSPFVLLFLAAALFALFARFHSAAFLTFYEDDAFYYFQIARNILAGHGSSFDGTHLTNGYHPLWMLVIVPLMLVAHGKTFFIALQAVIFSSFAATFLLLRGLFLRASRNAALSNLCAGLIGIGCLILFRGGMEITLTLPLTLSLVSYRLRDTFRWSTLQAVRYGLLAALVILSRLDAVLLVTLLFVFEFLPVASDLSSQEETASSEDAKKGPAVLLAAATTLLPLAFYAFTNHHFFHTWTTVSSQAKQLRPHHTFTLAQITASLEPVGTPYRILVLYPAIFLLLLSATAFILRKKSDAPFRTRPSRHGWAATTASGPTAALILFPFLQLLAFFTLSDWLIWPWYIYSIPLAATGATLYLLHRETPPVLNALTPVLQTIVLFVAVLYAAACTADRVHSRWYVFAEDLAPFARTHDGIYAMGDCAGTPAWVTEKPFIQLEGLAMDEPFLDNIRQRRNLNDVLASYDVRYYVTQDAVLTSNGCYVATEPYQGGPDSPHMTGTFCQQPVASFQHGTGPRSTLRVFELK